MKKLRLLCTTFIISLFFTSPVLHAALSHSAVLNFNTPSFWGFDFDDNGTFSLVERTQIYSLHGIELGTTQPASGNHINGIDGSEAPNIDQPWVFAGNTGMHQTLSNSEVASDDGFGNALIDFSGWSMAYAQNNDIPLSTGAWGGNADGIATLTCVNDCSLGDTFTLFYTATVPAGDPSSFGDIKYCLGLTDTGNDVDADCVGLTGIIGDTSVVPIPQALWLFGSGLLGLIGVARRKT